MIGRIIRIFNEHRVVINLGSDHGVEGGMSFDILTPPDEIQDPETGETLGSYSRRKAEVAAVEVFPRFTVAVPPPQRERLEERDPLRFGLSSRRYRSVPGRLNIEHGQAHPLPTGDEVRLGDIAQSPDPQPEDVNQTADSHPEEIDEPA